MTSISAGRESSYLQLLGTLFLVLRKIRRNGLMSIEADIENPEESAVFNTIAKDDNANEVVYIFIFDVLRLMVGGNLNVEDFQRYMDAYRKTTVLSDEQSALFECARLTLVAMLNGNNPGVAVEHGRQGILAKAKPSYLELDEFIRTIESELEPDKKNLDARLVKFYASLGAA